jgi:hypothetical protein
MLRLDLRLRLSLGFASLVSATGLALMPAAAGQPKLDAETCKQLHVEQATFIQSGILADLQRGADWGKSNLSASRLREIEQYILLDEQIKFACREATLTPEMEKASEVAKRLELDPNADPLAPLPDPATQDAAKAAAGDDEPNPPSGGAVVKKKPAAKPKPVKKPAETQAERPADPASESNVRSVPLTAEPIP